MNTINHLYFLTSNPKKAEDFTSYGFSIKKFDKEIPEVLSPYVETVALYKAKDTQLNNILVEDTSLTIEGLPIYGTEIKHIYEHIKDDETLHGRMALWEVSVCLKMDNVYYISTGKTSGVLQYPALNFGYHFDRIFSIQKNNQYCQFELLTAEEKLKHSPRFIAIEKMVNAIKKNDFSQLRIVKEKDIPEWTQDYQIEKKKNISSIKSLF